MKKTILALGAHHDDIELRAGGTLAKHAKEGSRVVYAVASTTPHYNPWPGDEEAGKFLSNNDVIRLRKKEAEEGARIIGAGEVLFLDFKSIYWYMEGTHDRVYLDGVNCTSRELAYLEGQIPGREFLVSARYVESAVEFLACLIEEKEAEIVLTHTPDDRHLEHYATACLALSAVLKLREKGNDVNLYGWEFGGTGTLCFGFNPSRFEDITDTIDIKCEALMSFRSQFAARNPEFFLSRARKRAQAYGKLCGFKYAEPFVDFNLGCSDAGEELSLPETYRPPGKISGIE